MRKLVNYSNIFRRIGLGSAYGVGLVNNPVDRSRDKSAPLSSSLLDVENIGTLKFVNPRLVIRVPFNQKEYSNSAGYTSYRTWKTPIQENEYVFTQYTASIDLRSNPLGFFHFPPIKFDVQSNNFFKKYVNTIFRFKKISSTNWDTDESRFTSYEGKAPLGNIPLNIKFGYSDQPLSYFNKSGVFNSAAYGYNDLPFARIHFISGNTNNLYAQKIEQNDYLNSTGLVRYSQRKSIGYTSFNFDQNTLPGFTGTYFKTGSGANLEAINKKFTKSIKPSKYLEWNSTFTNGLTSNNYVTGGFESSKKYYIPFPNTVQATTFYKSKVATKFAFLDTYNNNLEINGILMISTGQENGNQKICYISPHKINPRLANTIDDFYTFDKKSFSSGINKKLVTGYKQTSDVFQVNILELTSKYNQFYPPNNFDEHNLSNSQWVDFVSVGKYNLDTQDSSYYTTGYGYEYQESKFLARESGSHLQQIVPIKDTPFYKFYKDIYTGSKTFNTGSWNGIVPTGVSVFAELITTVLDTEAGINLDCVQIYSGHGNEDPTDLKINSVFSADNCKKYLQRTKKDGVKLIYTAYNTADNFSEAVMHAKNMATNKLSKNIFKLLKSNAPEIVVFNKKYDRLKSFQNKINNKKLGSGIYDYIPNQYISTTVTY